MINWCFYASCFCIKLKTNEQDITARLVILCPVSTLGAKLRELAACSSFINSIQA